MNPNLLALMKHGVTGEVSHRDRLRNLQLEHFWLGLRIIERGYEMLEKRRVLELLGRHVHSDADRHPLVAPLLGLLQCSLKHPSSDWHHQSRLLGDWNEVAR